MDMYINNGLNGSSDSDQLKKYAIDFSKVYKSEKEKNLKLLINSL